MSEPDVDENGWEVACHVCGKSSGTLMECEFELNGGSFAVCSRSYHARCAGLARVPQEEFVCPKHSSKVESEEAGSVYNDSDGSSSSTENSSDSDFSSDADLGAFVDRYQKVIHFFSHVIFAQSF